MRLIEAMNAGDVFLGLKVLFPRAFFFESAQLSVIGLDYDEVLRLRGAQVEVTRGGLTQVCEEDFLTVVQTRLSEFPSKAASFPYEFGGVFGCLGYEVMGLIEPKLQKQGYFRDLSQGTEVLAEVFVSHNVIVFHHATNQIHFALRDHQLGLADLPTRRHRGPARVLSNEVEEALKNHGTAKFLRAVQSIKSHIQQGNIFQAVLSQRFEVAVETSAIVLFESVRALCPSSYSFYFDFKESQFFGASPETLLKIEDGELETHPIAGTRPRGQSAVLDRALETELLSDEKEAAEHLMLVDLSRNDIGRVAQAGSVRVAAFRELMHLPNVMHLISVVRGTKKIEKTDLAALCSCFPAGTLTGAPKLRAMEVLAELESRPRGFYGGAVVAFDFAGGLDSCIAIRSVEVKHGQAILRAGAGIVADSTPEAEYQEIIHKLRGLVCALQSAETCPELLLGVSP